jgi:hypothetical protein
MLTEDQAKGLLCCGPNAAYPNAAKAPRCAGSECMAWRWAPLPGTLVVKGSIGIEDWEAATAGSFIPLRPGESGMPEPLPRLGYCGLAGKP